MKQTNPLYLYLFVNSVITKMAFQIYMFAMTSSIRQTIYGLIMPTAPSEHPVLYPYDKQACLQWLLILQILIVMVSMMFL